MTKSESDVAAQRVLDRSVDLPAEVEDWITSSLEQFAEKNGFELKALYHNESLWFLLRKERGLTTRIQVAAYGSWQFTELRFIPDAYHLDEGAQRLRTLPHVRDNSIQKLALRDLRSAKDPAASILECLGLAVKALEQIQPHQLTTEITLAST